MMAGQCFEVTLTSEFAHFADEGPIIAFSELTGLTTDPQIYHTVCAEVIPQNWVGELHNP